MTAIAKALAPTRSRTNTLKREQHQPDYIFLTAVIGLVAIGVLMVYSSSAMTSFLSDDDQFKVVGPQVIWAALGLVSMAIVTRIDYRYWRLVSVPLFIVALTLLVIVLFVPSLNYVVGGSARFLRIGPLPLFHPAEIAKLALVIYLAHWFARRGSGIKAFWGGTVIFLVIAGPVVLLVLREPDIGTTSVLVGTALVMFFVAGANLVHLGALGGTVLLGATAFIATHSYALTRVRAFIDPWSDPSGSGFHTIQGLLALGLGGLFGSGLGESRLAGRAPAQRLQRLHLRDHRRGVRPGRRGARHLPVRGHRLPGHPDRTGRSRHVRRPARGRDHRLDLRPGVHQHRRRRGAPAGDRDHAAVRQRRRLVAGDHAHRRRYPPVRISGDRGEGDLERCVC